MDEMEKRMSAYDMLYLIGCGIHGVKPDITRLKEMNKKNLYQMSRFHNLTVIVYVALEIGYENNIPENELLVKWRESRDKAIRKNMLLDSERVQLEAYCEKIGIWYLPLKGIILKDLYPMIGMREMADNDILFDCTHQKDIYNWFVNREYKVKTYHTGTHDVYLKEPVYNFEMHTSLFSGFTNHAFSVYYEDIKNRLLLDKNKLYGYHFGDEDFYIYMMAHTYKHYGNSGTGLRSLLDCYVYSETKKGELDWNYINTELAKLDILNFGQEMIRLAYKVFSDPHKISPQNLTMDEKKMLEYFMYSGTYGTQEYRVRNKLRELNPGEVRVSLTTKLLYVGQRMFPDENFMLMWCASNAPIFLRFKFLMPIAFFWRLLFQSITKFKKGMKELKSLWEI